eukprot:7547-Eustigmatos_ZCMA.PRE.1
MSPSDTFVTLMSRASSASPWSRCGLLLRYVPVVITAADISRLDYWCGTVVSPRKTHGTPPLTDMQL